jgi:tellurite resistance protein
MAEQARLKNFPISWFATIMGLAGLTIAWHKTEAVYQLSLHPSQWLSYITLAAFVVVAAIYLMKLLAHREAVIAELNHPIRLSFFPAVSIALILLSIVFLQSLPAFSGVLWMVGVVIHLLFTLYVLNAWISHPRFEIKHINPAWFIPVVGNILVPIAGVHHVPVDISWFFFSIGLVFWILLFAMVLYRMFFHDPIPAKLVPTLFILIAPPAVGFVSYLKLNGELDNFGRILYFMGLFLTLMLFTQFTRFSRLQFFLSWWAYSFPLAAITVATLSMTEHSAWALYDILAIVLLVILNAVLLMLVVRTLKAIGRKEICVEEE